MKRKLPDGSGMSESSVKRKNQFSRYGIVPSPSAHDEFAWMYNRYWGAYASESIIIIHELLLYQLPQKAKILDLGCGTGQLAAELTDRGYPVTGIDIAEEMLNFARKNAPNAEFIRQDARNFNCLECYDAVISTYDSLNYIVNPEELDAVFHNVNLSLKPGGSFLFDLNTESGYVQHWDDGIFEIVEDDHVCIVQSIYDTETRSARFDVVIFRLHDGWHRSDLTFFQRCYSESEIRLALKIAGFVDIKVWGFHDELGLGDISTESERLYFLCRKSGETQD